MSEPLVLDGQLRRLGGVDVMRVLPSRRQRTVGPFTFLDHIGPTQLAAGSGIDVPPHPHIHLATVTYLFEGELLHRDSLGTEQLIVPGEINWMTAGRGIVHSERTPAALRVRGSRVHGLQLWVALPTAHEEDAPSFRHHGSAELPTFEVDDVSVKLLAGSAFGRNAPVATLSPLFYAEARMPAHSTLALPVELQERAVYVIDGEAECMSTALGPRQLAMVTAGAFSLRARTPCHVVVLGGAPLDGKRYMFWNFVSSSQASIERAKRDWKEDRFPKVPGDDIEFVPLPE